MKLAAPSMPTASVTASSIAAAPAGLRPPAPRPWLPKLLGAIALLLLAGNVLQYFRNSPSRPVAYVGASVISKRDYQAELDTVAGKYVMNRLVFRELVRQAALKAGVLPSPQEVAARIAEMRAHNAVPAAPDDVAMALALENLRIRGVSAGDSEIANFYAQHKSLFAQRAKVTLSLVVTGSAPEAARAAALLAEGVPEASIADRSGMRVAGVNGFAANFDALSPAERRTLQQAIATLADGDIKTIHVGGQYMTLRANHHQAASQQSLAQARADVARLVKLQKAPSAPAELAALYKANPPSFESDKYAQFFSDFSQPGTPATQRP